jgi:hypothetical protein
MKKQLVRTAAGMTLLSFAIARSPLGAQGISYTVAPAVESINWDSSLGLKNHSLYGGQASLDFDNLISLQGYYFTNDKIGTAVDKLGLSGNLANQLTNQRLRIRSTGANVIWKFWKGGITPFLKTGGGVIELRPDSGRATKQIALNLGGGLRIGGDAPLHLDLFAEDMILRVDRYALFNQGTSYVPADPNAKNLRHNFVLGAALGVPLGRKSDDNATGDLRWGLTGASLNVEPFAGQMRFDDKSLRNQDLVGARAGIDVGRYVGVRGFYWRGTDNNFKRLQSLQSWGGEMQFRLNSSTGLTPYLLGGAAQLDFKQNDTTASAQKSDNKFALILGGGVSLPLGERLAINATARDYLYGRGNGADSVSSPSDLKNNWLYTVGIRLSVFGHSGSNAADRTRTRVQMLEARVREDSITLAMERDGRMPGGRNGNASASNGMRSSIDSNRVRTVMVDGRRVVIDSAGQVVRGNAGNVITLPVPTVGELYVRYGSAGAVSIRSGQPLTAADSAAQRSALDSARVAAMNATDREAAMNRRIDSIVTARVNERTGNQPAPSTTTIVIPGAAAPVVVPQVAPASTPPQIVVDQPRYSWTGNSNSTGLMVYSALTFTNAAQISLGGRFDLGPLGGGTSPFHFVPEIAIGGGSGGRSTMIVANAEYMFGKFLVSNRMLQPHIIAGVGLLNFSNRVGSHDGLEGVINVGYGVSIPFKSGTTSGKVPVLTLEHQGIDFFQLNRLLVGLSWRM